MKDSHNHLHEINSVYHLQPTCQISTQPYNAQENAKLQQKRTGEYWIRPTRGPKVTRCTPVVGFFCKGLY